MKGSSLMTPAVLRLVLYFFVLVSASGARAETYDIDASHTEVRFTWDHLGLSRQGGRFTSLSGKVDFDPDAPEQSTVEVKIPVRSIATGVKALDEALVGSKDYFDVVLHPDITFKSTSVTLRSDKTADVAGDLTINGVTRSVVLDVVWSFTGPHPLRAINPVYAGKISSGFSATTQIRRGDWGITRGAPFVSDEIRISIEAEMLRLAPLEGGEPVEALSGDAALPEAEAQSAAGDAERGVAASPGDGQ
jgi:polyisoprenoid-binding protein YceI